MAWAQGYWCLCCCHKAMVHCKTEPTAATALLRKVIIAYTKVRVLLRAARRDAWTREHLTERLMNAVMHHETGVMHRMAGSFYKRSGELRRKRQNQGWGNVRIVWDTLHRLLAAEVESWILTRKTSKNWWIPTFLKRVLLECFRARAIAHTSNRYARLLQGGLIKKQFLLKACCGVCMVASLVSTATLHRSMPSI